MNLGTVNELTSTDYKHCFLIKTPYMTEPAWSEGSFSGGRWGNLVTDSKLHFSFKTKDNPSKIGSIIIDKGVTKIERMLYNKPIPNGIEIFDYKRVPLYSENEKKLIDKVNNFHLNLKRRCYNSEYLKIGPTPLYISKLNKTINVEYITLNWFSTDDIINYRSDHVKISDLTIEEIEKLTKIL